MSQKRTRMMALGLSALAAVAVMRPAAAQPSPARISIDATTTHQTFEGFGSTPNALAGPNSDNLTPDQRARVIDDAFNQVHLTLGLAPPLVEAKNSNSTPLAINWSGFDPVLINLLQTKVIGPSESLGFRNDVLGVDLNTRLAMRWMANLRSDYAGQYLNAATAYTVASVMYYRDHLGTAPPYVMPFNEPLSGANLVEPATTRDLVDIVKRSGHALADAGVTGVKFIVPSEETPAKSLDEAQAIMADPDAAQFVGVIAYHSYPYESAFNNVAKILATSGSGTPDQDQIAVRQRLRDLAEQNGVELWMTEASNGGDAFSYDDFRARAVHIHDEMVYADASAYYGMETMFDMQQQKAHFGNNNLASREGTIVLIDNGANTVTITGMGYAIGQYARWLHAGDVRIDASSGDPLVQVVAFRDDAQAQIVAVAINNADADRNVSFSLTGPSIGGPVSGEQSTRSGGYWQTVPAFGPDDATSFSTTLPRSSVTTFVLPIAS